MDIIDYIIVTSYSASQLSIKVKQLMVSDHWIPIGNHSVVETHHQLKYSGKQHMQTVIKSEYSQTLIKNN